MGPRRWSLITLLAIASADAACVAEPSAEPMSTPLAIVGGQRAPGPELDAIGTLADIVTDPITEKKSLNEWCSGTFIGGRAILTSESCASAAARYLDNDARVVFAIGGDPAKRVEVFDTHRIPEGALSGTDGVVGIVFLRDTPRGLEPAEVAPTTDGDVGRPLLAVGLGDLDSWVTGVLTPRREVGEVVITARAESTVKIGSGPTGARPCGDHGGPLLRITAGRLTVLGVYAFRHNAPDGTTATTCAQGVTYTSFDANVLTIIAAARSEPNPCGSESVAGSCQGSVAQRCTGLHEGLRRLVRIDCANLGLPCARQADGIIGCGTEKPPPLLRPTGLKGR